MALKYTKMVSTPLYP